MPQKFPVYEFEKNMIQPNLLAGVVTFRGWSLLNGIVGACVVGVMVVVTGISPIHATWMQINVKKNK